VVVVVDIQGVKRSAPPSLLPASRSLKKESRQEKQGGEGIGRVVKRVPVIGHSVDTANESKAMAKKAQQRFVQGLFRCIRRTDAGAFLSATSHVVSEMLIISILP
jgi:hypothetical protein